jgi:raffinose/stachyose/melibiose transport system permease protein
MSAQRFRVLPRNREFAEYGKRRREASKYATVVAFLLPGLAIFTLFLIVPVFQSAYLSVYRWNGFGPPTNYVGLANYDRLLHHDVFGKAVSHSLIIVVLSLTTQLPLALGLALLVGRGKLPGKAVFRMAFFIPYVFSEIITAIIWGYVFHPHEGLVNSTFKLIIPGYENHAWLGHPDTVMLAIFIVISWKYFGMHMILYMAGLQGVPRDLEDAARVDGATELHVLRYVTLPCMGSTIRLTVYLSVLGSLQQYIIPWTLTEGGPVNASEVMVTYLYKFGIQRFHLGYGSAIAVVLFLTTLVFSLGYQRTVMRKDYADDVLAIKQGIGRWKKIG